MKAFFVEAKCVVMGIRCPPRRCCCCCCCCAKVNKRELTHSSKAAAQARKRESGRARPPGLSRGNTTAKEAERDRKASEGTGRHLRAAQLDRPFPDKDLPRAASK